jgi:hypothetical protein
MTKYGYGNQGMNTEESKMKIGIIKPNFVRFGDLNLLFYLRMSFSVDSVATFGFFASFVSRVLIS